MVHLVHFSGQDFKRPSLMKKEEPKAKQFDSPQVVARYFPPATPAWP
ncbi:hypothetical protein [Bradyrhizobium japonicum]|nr:hypothetical protein [Bradyrhizobium japonicum]MBR0916466.1 hypothetical protein [Bradyrhizobium japonicum]